jgi:lysophospholipase L1-like esterase
MPKLTALLIITASLTLLIYAATSRPTIHLIGDSTMADKPLDDNPERGWGQLFPLYFTPDIEIINYARNGRSTKSFIDQGLWDKVLKNLKPGDYVLIQFGHNDAKISDTTRYAEAHTAYRANLKRYVQETRSKGANPVLITPVNRRKFSDAGEFIDQHGDYPMVVRELARELNVPLLDLHARSLELFSTLGPEKSEALFLRADSGVYKFYPNGKSDNTHFNRTGAIQVAELVIAELHRIKSPLVKYLGKPPKFSDEARGKIVGLDYFYNHEIRKDKDGQNEQYHYTWEDRTNSGFYEWGNLFENQGAFIAEVTTAPTPEILQKLSVYIIVDPDTPAENPAPNYIDAPAIKALVEWVNQGGVLVLLGNDAGNAEFTHFNALAEKFGIHFNEVSVNRVTAKNYELGAIKTLPMHPIFDGVSKIYMKDIATLKLTAPAQSLLTDNGAVVIATAHIGSGMVCAIGDPWLYNEYIDNRKLPADFENFKAAQNFCRWLLQNAKCVR